MHGLLLGQCQPAAVLVGGSNFYHFSPLDWLCSSPCVFPTNKPMRTVLQLDRGFQNLYPKKCHPRLLTRGRKTRPNCRVKKNLLETVVVSLVLDCRASWKTKHLQNKWKLLNRREKYEHIQNVTEMFEYKAITRLNVSLILLVTAWSQAVLFQILQIII